MFGVIRVCGQRVVIRKVASRAKDSNNQRYRWGGRVDERIRAMNRRTSGVRSKVEHSIGKRVCGFQKVRYRGLAKNLHRLQVTAGPANLVGSSEIP